MLQKTILPKLPGFVRLRRTKRSNSYEFVRHKRCYPGSFGPTNVGQVRVAPASPAGPCVLDYPEQVGGEQRLPQPLERDTRGSEAVEVPSWEPRSSGRRTATADSRLLDFQELRRPSRIRRNTVRAVAGVSRGRL